jgi:hypothetical protein
MALWVYWAVRYICPAMNVFAAVVWVGVRGAHPLDSELAGSGRSLLALVRALYLQKVY